MDRSLLRLALSGGGEQPRTELEVRRIAKGSRMAGKTQALARMVEVKHGEGDLWRVVKLQAWTMSERPATEDERAAFLATYNAEARLVP